MTEFRGDHVFPFSQGKLEDEGVIAQICQRTADGVSAASVQIGDTTDVTTGCKCIRTVAKFTQTKLKLIFI